MNNIDVNFRLQSLIVSTIIFGLMFMPILTLASQMVA